MAFVTRIAPSVRGRVRVEVDGKAWREFPLEAVVRARLAEGTELDRERLRALARARRGSDALSTAARLLRRRDHSSQEVDEALVRRGVPPASRRETVSTLRARGYVDDGRFALARASLLAERGAGDALIRADLECRGVLPETIAAALAAIEPERVRAEALMKRRGGGLSAVRFLARRGFEDDLVEEILLDVAPDGDAALR